ncbi:MFS transporter [Streptomyces telluris]|uniref:MFS transporter n=1 Tax=Streptomyces telluris TaxID=2720021 RepID=A0A9X2RLF3_9ACTN|nr:MFS transporter [Streptomyces telluris]MCQ8770877.1 MFS transporter [Streptomyces telluris]NJP79561.1 MFS transporter [Streptomyces telluris]
MPTPTPSPTAAAAVGPAPVSPAGSAAPAAPAAPAPAPARGGNTVLLAVIALCTAVTAANIYLAAPLLGLIAQDFGAAPSAAGWIASVAQLGYAIGLLAFAPLGDTADRRRLVAVLSGVAGAALVAAAFAPGLPALAAAVLVACAATVVPQLLVPLVAERAPADRRGRHVAAVVAGLFTGIVAARVLGSLAGQAYGWRAVFLGAAALTVAIGLLTAVMLPAETRPRRAARPLKAIAGLPGLLRRSPELRAACLRQAGLFGAWSSLWTTLALLLTADEPFHMSTATAGLFGLFGLVSTAVAPVSGSLIDRFGATRVVTASYVLTALSLPLFWLGGHRLWALCTAAVLIHAGLMAGQVANQTRALASTGTPAAANTAYVVTAFVGGASASALAGPAYAHWGWNGVCAIAAAAVAVGWAGSALVGAKR